MQIVEIEPLRLKFRLFLSAEHLLEFVAERARVLRLDLGVKFVQLIESTRRPLTLLVGSPPSRHLDEDLVRVALERFFDVVDDRQGAVNLTFHRVGDVRVVELLFKRSTIGVVVLPAVFVDLLLEGEFVRKEVHEIQVHLAHPLDDRVFVVVDAFKSPSDFPSVEEFARKASESLEFESRNIPDVLLSKFRIFLREPLAHSPLVFRIRGACDNILDFRFGEGLRVQEFLKVVV